MGVFLMVEALNNSAHRGSRLLLMLMLANNANDDDRVGTAYMDTLAKKLGLKARALQNVMSHLESSGEIVVWNRPNKACNYAIRVLPVEWPEDYLNGILLDRSRREMWTNDLENSRKEIKAHNAGVRQRRIIAKRTVKTKQREE